jgi:succinate-semialdehyde dehydrogenase / glutarate-semialdehyde dehydrogenase
VTALAPEPSVLPDVPTRCWIGGTWTDAAGGATFPVEDPATGEILARVADGGAEEGLRALTAASEAAPGWAATSPASRAALLRRVLDRVERHADELALVISREMGKPLAEAAGEVTYGAGFLRWFAEEAGRIHDERSLASDGRRVVAVSRRPVGPCLLVTPWNFPFAMATRKIAPALAAGCTCVLKPAELTPLTSLIFAWILDEAGVPPGVVNVVTTSRPGEVCGPVLDDPRLRKLSFTGSTAVGVELLRRSAGNVLRTSMELGGNAPFLVFDDADLDAAVAGAMAAKFRNGGQACTAANRFLVQRGVAEAFTARFADAVRALRIGPGTTPGVDVGPLADARAVDKVAALVDDAVARGARVLVGGRRPSGPGHF